MEQSRLKQILEAALLAAGRPLTVADLETLFAAGDTPPTRDEIRAALAELASGWEQGSLALQQVASGYRAQVRAEFEPWLRHLWDEKPPRYSRALLETLAIIAYRQPITRPEIEDIRGVSVSTQIMRTLQEREWVRVVGHRDAPGKPAMYGTTRQFLDYFNLKSLDQLPPVAEIRDLESRYPELALEGEPGSGQDEASAGAAAGNGDETVKDDDGIGDDAATVQDPAPEPEAPGDARADEAMRADRDETDPAPGAADEHPVDDDGQRQ